jgi:A/G-specific adenine glycosylase
MEDIHTLLQHRQATPEAVSLFQDSIWRYYREYGRRFPWRETSDPYHILVSEFMLQQTQTSRVVSKYTDFISRFPDFFTLAEAPLRDVLQVWQGLGYNRRALALQQTTHKVVTEFDGHLPSNLDALQKLPGVGPCTASAVAAFAFNKPTVFIETNIRAVFTYFFFKESEHATDNDIRPLVEKTLDRTNIKEWYYALFDYGAMIKRQCKQVTRSTHRTQSPFRGSNREKRGRIIRLLLTRESITEHELTHTLSLQREHVRQLLAQLCDEGFIEIRGGLIRIK